jgi:hypothetical protein
MMEEPRNNSATGNDSSQKESAMFHTSTETPKSSIPWQVWAVAAVACCIVVAVLYFSGHKKPLATNPAQPDAYAASLSISNIQMSEASNMAGGKMTYIDGSITNHGQKTVTAVTVSTTFANDMGVAPQILTEGIQIIRAREPYIDTESLSAAPIQPGETKEFRLIFEQVTPSWNQVTPVIQVLRVETR